MLTRVSFVFAVILAISLISLPTARADCDPIIDCSGGKVASVNVTVNGVFNNVTCACDCNSGWIGTNCTTPQIPCVNGCSGLRGTCDETVGKCVCETGFSGDTCNTVSCPTGKKDANGIDIGTQCNARGKCDSIGICQCDVGWIGTECTIEISEAGMTRGQLAGAVIGGLLVSFLIIGLIIGGMIYFDAFSSD